MPSEQLATVADLSVRLGRLSLSNPVLVASGTFGYVREMASFVPLSRLGGVIPKTVTARPRAGNATPRTVETASGLLNAIGLDNDGIDHFRDDNVFFTSLARNAKAQGQNCGESQPAP